MSKYNISCNVDMMHIAPDLFIGNAEPQDSEVSEVITSLILEGARARAKEKLQAFRHNPDIDLDVKTVQMSEQLRAIMLTIMLQANLHVERVSPETYIETRLPFEIANAA